MWVAQWPDGSWILYRGKPRLKMGGWDGEIVGVVCHNFDARGWKQNLIEVKEDEV